MLIDEVAGVCDVVIRRSLDQCFHVVRLWSKVLALAQQASIVQATHLIAFFRIMSTASSPEPCLHVDQNSSPWSRPCEPWLAAVRLTSAHGRMYWPLRRAYQLYEPHTKSYCDRHMALDTGKSNQIEYRFEDDTQLLRPWDIPAVSDIWADRG